MPFAILPGGLLIPGVNYRLAYGWDFGRSPGEPLGIADAVRSALVEEDFRQLAAHGVRMVRWFVFCDGRNGILFDGETPAGLEPGVVSHVRAALDTASRHGLGVLFVLLDHTFCFVPERISPDMVKQGHGRVLRLPRLFEALVANVFVPLFAAIRDHPALIGFELINEPEMVMQRRESWYGAVSGVGCPSVPVDAYMSVGEMRECLEKTREAVHAATDAQFSIGSMTAAWMGRWADLLDPARDFLTFHYYGDEPNFERMLEERVVPYTSGMAVGLGEFYPQGRSCLLPGRPAWPDISTSQFLEIAARYRLQLALAWVCHPGVNDPGEVPLEAYLAFSNKEAHNEEHARSTSLHAS